MFCIKCGKELPDGASFCMYCGTQLGTIGVTAKDEEVKYATVTVYRTKKFQGAAQGINILVDGTPMAFLKNGESASFEVTCGKHTFNATGNMKVGAAFSLGFGTVPQTQVLQIDVAEKGCSLQVDFNASKGAVLTQL